MGGQAGVLQGERRWLLLAAWSTWPLACPGSCSGRRWWCGSPSEFTAMFGVALGRWSPVVVGYFALRRPRSEHADRDELHIPSILRRGRPQLAGPAGLLRPQQRRRDRRPQRPRRPRRRSLRRRPDHDQGRAVPAAVLVVVAFPSMSTREQRGRLVRGCWSPGRRDGRRRASLLSSLAMIFVGGAEYSEIESRLWLFAVLGTLLACSSSSCTPCWPVRAATRSTRPGLALVLVVVLGLNCDSLESTAGRSRRRTPCCSPSWRPSASISRQRARAE